MVLAQVRVPWFADADYGKTFNVKKVNVVQGKYGPEHELELETDNFHFCKISCWGVNLNYMINTFGRDTDEWIDARIIVDRIEVPWKEGTIKVIKQIRKA